MRTHHLTHQQQTKLLWLAIAVSIIGYICFMLLYPVNARADLKKDMQTVLEKHGPGEEVAVYGKMIPSSALGEWKKAQRALRDARISLLKALERAQMMDSVPEWATRLSGRLDALTNDFNSLVKENVKEHEDMNLDDKALIGVLAKFSKELDGFSKELHNLKKELDGKMNRRNEGWSFGLAAYGSAEYATGKQEVMPIGGIGLSGSFRKEKLSLDFVVGAGVSVVGYTSVSWTFIPSLQFYLSDELSVGPAMVLSQDLGNMEGADRLVWQAGLKLKTNLLGLNLWVVPSFGVQGERGHGATDPTYSPNVGMTLGMDYAILK